MARETALRAGMRIRARAVAETLSWERIFDEFEEVLFGVIANNTSRPAARAAYVTTN